ncbi:MAG: hypothetical protein MRQ13_05090 [Candidatus Midichloria sp.]|nr:hypothetical protein [Candidatus Midichloria sp.]
MEQLFRNHLQQQTIKETNSLPTVATILYGASYVVNAVVVPFRIGMEVCCFIISSALIGLIGFLMGDTTKLETNK